MTRCGLGWRPRSAPAPQIRLVTVVWGASYVESLIRIAWRALLAPGNLPSMAAEFDVSYALYVRDTEVSAIEQSAQFRLLSQLARIDVHVFGTKTQDKDRYTQHWNLWRDAVDRARRDQSVVLLVIPDVILFDGTLQRWTEFLKSGKRAIFSIGTWVSEETFLPEFLSRYPLETQHSVALSRGDGLTLMLKHMHPVVAAAFRESGHALYHFDRMTDSVLGQGFASRSFSAQPLLFDPTHFVLDRNSSPTNRFADIAMDEVCMLSTGPMLHVAEFYHAQPQFAERGIPALVGWAPPNLGMSQAYESKYSYRYQRQDVPLDAEAWTRAEQSLDDTRRGVLAIHAISQLWQHALAHGCNRVCDAVAVASWRFDLHRSINVERDYTVLLPVDEAFSGSEGELLDAAIANKAEGALISLIREHVVPRRLYLRPDDRLLIGSQVLVRSYGTGHIVADAMTVSGKRLLAIRGGSNLPPGATVIGRQARVGFGAVYQVDRILGSQR